jgi:hypothetical protein
LKTLDFKGFATGGWSLRADILEIGQEEASFDAISMKFVFS